MKAREARFLGHGNFGIGEGNSKTRAWRVTCARCQDIKVIALPRGDLPPDWLLKKFTRAGWYIDKHADGDLCPDCQKKRPAPAPHVNGAPVPISAELADQVHQKELAHALQKAITATKEREAALLRLQETQLLLMALHHLITRGDLVGALDSIERWFPKVSWARRHNGSAATAKPAPVTDDAFDEWLTDLDNQHRQGAAR